MTLVHRPPLKRQRATTPLASLTSSALSLALSLALAGCVTTATQTGEGARADAAAVAPSPSRALPASTSPSPARAAAAAGGAYQLQDCKPADGWAILGGGCNSFSLFSGRGSGVRGALFFTGAFENGLPHGKGTLCFRSVDQDDARNGRLDCNKRLSCSVEFNAGRLQGPEMACQMAGSANAFGKQRAGLQLTLRSASGFFIDDGLAKGQQKDRLQNGRLSTITTDQAQVEISGQVSYGPLRIDDTSAAASAVGELRQVSLNADSVQFDRFNGQLAIPSRKVRGGAGELRVKGVFSGRIGFDRAEFQPYAGVVSKQGEVTRASLVELAASGRNYQLVFDKQPGSPQVNASRVIYYKDDAGVEFDGTAGGCFDKHKRQGFAELKVQRENSSGTFLGYELVPYCGKINTPSGSYAGDFRDGRPAN